MNIFKKTETIGEKAQSELLGYWERYKEKPEDAETIIREIHEEFGESIERMMLVKAISDDCKRASNKATR